MISVLLRVVFTLFITNGAFFLQRRCLAVITVRFFIAGYLSSKHVYFFPPSDLMSNYKCKQKTQNAYKWANTMQRHKTDIMSKYNAEEQEGVSERNSVVRK